MKKNCLFGPPVSCGLLQPRPGSLQLRHRREMGSERLPGSMQRARHVTRVERFAEAITACGDLPATSGERERPLRRNAEMKDKRRKKKARYLTERRKDLEGNLGHMWFCFQESSVSES